jgi:hypothetical protein
MAAQLTLLLNTPEDGWPWLFPLLLPNWKFEKGATSKSAVEVAITVPCPFFASYTMCTRALWFPELVALPLTAQRFPDTASSSSSVMVMLASPPESVSDSHPATSKPANPSAATPHPA